MNTASLNQTTKSSGILNEIDRLERNSTRLLNIRGELQDKLIRVRHDVPMPGECPSGISAHSEAPRPPRVPLESNIARVNDELELAINDILHLISTTDL